MLQKEISMTQPIRTKPEPWCPECGAMMLLKRPRAHQEFDPFWGCRLFPSCRATREILPDGTPEQDDVPVNLGE